VIRARRNLTQRALLVLGRLRVREYPKVDRCSFCHVSLPPICAQCARTGGRWSALYQAKRDERLPTAN
jgi:hypothetical protein